MITIGRFDVKVLVRCGTPLRVDARLGCLDCSELSMMQPAVTDNMTPLRSRSVSFLLRYINGLQPRQGKSEGRKLCLTETASLFPE